MKTIVQTILFLLITSGVQAQNLQLNPQAGQIATRYPIAVELADTGTNGTAQSWDFTGFSYENNTPLTTTYRLPTSDELTDFPLANLAAESETNGTAFYNVSPDSLTYAGSLNDIGPLVYSNLLKEVVYPFVAGQTYYDTAHYFYGSGGTTVDVDVYAEWEIVGNGSLTTSLGTYPETWKVRRTQRLEFYANGNLVETVHAVEYDWYGETHALSLLNIAYDDYNEATVATVLQAVGMAGLEETAPEQVIVFPNPAIDAFTVSGEFDRYELTDATGRTVRSGAEQTVVVSDLPEGHYTLCLYSGTMSRRVQVLKIQG
jgi:hypothetical protein